MGTSFTRELNMTENTPETAVVEKSFAENQPVIIALIVVGVLIVGFIAYLLSSAPPLAPVVSVPVPIIARAPVVEPEPEPEPEPLPPVVVEPEPPAFVLPSLNDSDQLIRDGVLSLTREESINTWLSPAELVRKFVVLVDNVAGGNIPKDAVRVLAPTGPFKVTLIEEPTDANSIVMPSLDPLAEAVYLLDTESYSRFDSVTRVFVSLDARRAAEFYGLLQPLFQQAYGELGYTDRQFDTIVFQAINRLLETPIVEKPIRLVRPVVMYLYADPLLENLSPAQKQLMRMGPNNTHAIQAKLGDLARELRALNVESR
ncbi:MAG: hypothetical protein ACI9SB_001098 [Candidatus Azotimanducaceae bacterium]|jgi:hypothetical protein